MKVKQTSTQKGEGEETQTEVVQVAVRDWVVKDGHTVNSVR